MYSTDREIVQQLHQYIHQADLQKLKITVDQIQRSLLHFDDPSLLLLAIEVYLDPLCVINQEYQEQVIIFLCKCGVKVWIPGGNVILYLYNWCVAKKIHTQANFETKLINLCDLLIDHDQTYILEYRLPTLEYFHDFQIYFIRQWAALKIQNCWRRFQKLNQK